MTEASQAVPSQAIKVALDRAAASCAHRGVALTPLRRDVLALVLAAEQPVGAYALLDQLRATRAGAAPPTVYRALDFLLAQGLIHRLERLNAYVACDHRHADDHGHDHAHDHPHQFLICQRCGGSTEICDAGLAQALREAALHQGFAIQRATVEVEGICARCGAQAG